MLYGGNSFIGWNAWLQNHNGANVWVDLEVNPLIPSLKEKSLSLISAAITHGLPLWYNGHRVSVPLQLSVPGLGISRLLPAALQSELFPEGALSTADLLQALISERQKNQESAQRIMDLEIAIAKRPPGSGR